MEATLGLNVHPAFLKFIDLCNQINFGTIRKMEIQNGVPTFVEYEVETDLNANVVQKIKLV